MKKGFTLAEILITLAIIGVIAALTIPSVVIKNQQREYRTAAKKAYSVLLQAAQLTEVKDGYTVRNDELFVDALIRNMNVTKIETVATNNLAGAAFADTPDDTRYGVGTIFYTADGIAYAVDNINPFHRIRFVVDVNGDKGPSSLPEGTISYGFCNDQNICDADNPEWPGYTLTDIFFIDINEGASRIYFIPRA